MMAGSSLIDEIDLEYYDPSPVRVERGKPQK
jgi:hypothetical protein